MQGVGRLVAAQLHDASLEGGSRAGIVVHHVAADHQAVFAARPGVPKRLPTDAIHGLARSRPVGKVDRRRQPQQRHVTLLVHDINGGGQLPPHLAEIELQRGDDDVVGGAHAMSAGQGVRGRDEKGSTGGNAGTGCSRNGQLQVREIQANSFIGVDTVPSS